MNLVDAVHCRVLLALAHPWRWRTAIVTIVPATLLVQLHAKEVDRAVVGRAHSFNALDCQLNTTVCQAVPLYVIIEFEV